MSRKLSIFMLIVLLVGQTIIGPIGSVAATGIDAPEEVTKDEIDNNETTETTHETTDKETKNIDKNKLKEALTDAEQYEEDDYTGNSFAQFVESVTAGEGIYEDNDATEDDVNEAIDAIEEAVGALQQKESSKAVGEESDANDSTYSEPVNTSESEDKGNDEQSDQNSIKPAHHDGHEGFKMNVSEIIDQDGNPYTEENPLGINDEFSVQLDWKLANNHNYQAGDHEVIQLPKEVYIPTMIEGELKDETSGNVIANYVVNTDGTVKLEFTEFIKEYSNITGWIEVFAKLDPNNTENDGGNVSISPIEDEGGISLPLDQSKIEKTTGKQGEPNRAYNADEIEWTVTINKNALFLEDASLTDILPEGTEYIDGSLEIEKYPANLNGTPTDDAESVIGITPSVDGNELTIPLGDINDVYVIKYKTKVTDTEKKSFNNKVTLTDKDLNDTSADATVTIDRGEPLKKGVVKNYNPKTGIIEWYLEFNYDQKQLNDVTLADNWKPEGKVELVDGSVSFQEVEIDGDGNAQPVGEKLDPSDLGNLKKKGDGFEVSGITTDKPYYVVYQTKVKERELDGFRLENLASFDEHEYGKEYNIGQYVGAKSAGNIDYAEKTIEWTIKVNMDERQMNDVIIKDTLGDGLTLIRDSIRMTIGGEAYTDFDLKGDNPFTLSNIGNTDKKIIVTYKTKYDPNKLPEDYYAHNKANISWIPKDSKDRINRDVEAKTKVNQATIDSSWKNASYNPDTKEITYEIIANYRENFYENFKIVDKPQQNQKLVEDSIEVYALNINANGDYKEDGDKLNIDPSITNNSFTLDFGETDRAYKITYKTTIENLDKIHQLYENKATVLDGDKEIANLKSSAQVYGKTKYGSKTGEQQGKKINWAVEVNNAQQVIDNLVFKDMIDSDVQEYLEDTITVYEATVNKNNGRLVKGDKFDATKYDLTVEEDNFILAWKDKVERAYIVEYSTLFFAKDQEEVKNNYKITGDSIEEDAKDAESGASVIVRQTEAGGSGESGYLTIEKLDTSYGQDIKPLEGITFEVIDKETGQVLKTESTDSKGYAEFGRLLFGTYILKEVNTPEGYVSFGEQEIEIDKVYDPNVEETYMFEVENYKRNGDVELLKKDEEGNTLEGAEFTLFTKDNTELKTKTTNEDGKVFFENLEVGNYYIQETEAPKGYLLDETKHEVEIAEDQKEPIQLEVKNKIDYETYTTEVPVEKVWKGEEAEKVAVKLFADGEEKETKEITAEDDWKHTFTDLLKYTEGGSEIEYTVKESLEGYKTEITGSAEDGFTITNTRSDETEVRVEKVWKGSEEESVTINLLANGEKVDDIDLSVQGDWTHVFENLPAYDEEGQPIEYTVEELQIDGYTSKITGNAEEGFTVTNTRTGETEVRVEKVWEDRNDKHELRPDSITINLLANGEEVGTVELSEENDWNHIFAELDAYDEVGEEIEYTVEEVEVAEYTTNITGSAEEGYTVTNTVKDYAIGDYVWVDRNKDGIQDNNEEPLEGVKVELYDEDGNKIAETETDENGHYIFDELPAGNYKVKFKLTEEQEKRYRFTKEQAGDDTAVDSDANEETGWTRKIVLNDDNKHLTKDYDVQEVKATEGIDPTWDAGVIELIQIPVEKIWIDNNNAEESRPDYITVNILANGEATEVTADLTAADGWAHIFKGLDKYDGNGEKIIYTIEEEAVENYVGDIEETDEGFIITNRLTKDLTPIIPITKVDVEKVWDGKALDEVTIILLADGEEVDRMILSDANNWKHTFNSLPKFSDSEFEQLIEYTVEEVEVGGYETTITGDMDEGFVVTNTEIPKDPEKDTEEVVEDEEDSSSILPKTATQMFLWIALGFALVALGITIKFTRRHRNA